MRALCIGRHAILSGHLCRYVSDCGVESQPAVGFDDAIARARAQLPDVVVCDYDLITSAALERWAREPDVRRLPIIAVSLTRRSEEVHVGDGMPLAGFLYLPTLARADAMRILRAAARASSLPVPVNLPFPGVPSVQLR